MSVEESALCVPLLRSIHEGPLAYEEPVAALVRFRFVNQSDVPTEAILPLRYSQDSTRSQNALSFDPSMDDYLVPRSQLRRGDAGGRERHHPLRRHARPAGRLEERRLEADRARRRDGGAGRHARAGRLGRGAAQDPVRQPRRRAGDRSAAGPGVRAVLPRRGRVLAAGRPRWLPARDARPAPRRRPRVPPRPRADLRHRHAGRAGARQHLRGLLHLRQLRQRGLHGHPGAGSARTRRRGGASARSVRPVRRHREAARQLHRFRGQLLRRGRLGVRGLQPASRLGAVVPRRAFPSHARPLVVRPCRGRGARRRRLGVPPAPEHHDRAAALEGMGARIPAGRQPGGRDGVLLLAVDELLHLAGHRRGGPGPRGVRAPARLRACAGSPTPTAPTW